MVDPLGVAGYLGADHPGGVAVVSATHRPDALAVEDFDRKRAGGWAVVRAHGSLGGVAHDVEPSLIEKPLETRTSPSPRKCLHDILVQRADLLLHKIQERRQVARSQLGDV